MIHVESILRGGEIRHFENNFTRINNRTLASTNPTETDKFMEELPDILTRKFGVPVTSVGDSHGAIIASTQEVIDAAVAGLKAAGYPEIIKTPTVSRI